MTVELLLPFRHSVNHGQDALQAFYRQTRIPTKRFPVVVITLTAMRQEEAYMERKFGAEYLSYKARVRRWL